MKNGILQSALLHQERQTTKLFLYLFYIISISYDGFYHYIYPLLYKGQAAGFQPSSVLELSYGTQFFLLLVAVILVRRGRPAPVKYLVFIGYTVAAVLGDMITYYNSPIDYKSGNIVEIFMVLFSPIFVNSRFYWVVTVGTLLKYTAAGLIAHTPMVLLPLLIVLVFSGVAFLLLNRFKGYMKAFGLSYSIRLENIVKGIVATLELKDPYTRGHSERVAHYALLLAEQTGRFDAEELQRFYQACLLHDIGKVNVPDAILTKSGSLTNQEYELIKKHTTVGAEAVKGIEGLEYCADVVLCHHERWDGRGYPQQLKAADIPFPARIVAVADAFDAMTTIRSYRPALPSEEAYTRILAGSGTQFDPQLVEWFKTVFPAWQQFLSHTQWKEMIDPEAKLSV